jgi:hypothetical protein
MQPEAMLVACSVAMMYYMQIDQESTGKNVTGDSELCDGECIKK